MQKQTNSAPSVHTAPENLKSQLNQFWVAVSAPTVSLKNLLFEQWINKWSYTVKVNVNACTKLYIKF